MTPSVCYPMKIKQFMAGYESSCFTSAFQYEINGGRIIATINLHKCAIHKLSTILTNNIDCLINTTSL